MEREGLSRADLEPRIGSRARVSEILHGRRPLTLAMIRRLRDALGIPADILVGGATTNVWFVAAGDSQPAGCLRTQRPSVPRSSALRRPAAPIATTSAAALAGTIAAHPH